MAHDLGGASGIPEAAAESAKLAASASHRQERRRGHRKVARARSQTLVGMLAALVVFCTSCKKPGSIELPPPIVTVMDVAVTNVPRSIEFIGQLDSPENVQVRARVEAFVKEVLFIEGTNVVMEQPLFRLDEQPFLERLAAANGSLAEAQAALKKYEADVARLKPLAEKKAIPLQDLDNAVASVAVGQANVLSAQARVESSKLDLGYCDIRAPSSGMIGAKQVSVGSLVGKGEPTLLATISTLNPIWFYCAISEVDYLRAKHTAREAGREMGELPVTLILSDGSEHPEPGKWVFLDRAVDVTTATIRARAQFANPDGVLRPGMFARVRISIRNEREMVLVPERSVVELQGKTFVWVIDESNKATQRAVKAAPERFGANVLILEGLKVGERFVLEGLQKVREGGAVQPMTPAQLAMAGAQLMNKKGAKDTGRGEDKSAKE